MTSIMNRLGMEEGEPIEHNLISKAIENAQAKVEGHNFDIRKQLIEYDDVMNQQREVIYRQRREALNGKSLKSSIVDMICEKAEDIAGIFADEKALPEEWDMDGLNEAVFKQFNFRLGRIDDDTLDGLTGARLLINLARTVPRSFFCCPPSLATVIVRGNCVVKPSWLYKAVPVM